MQIVRANVRQPDEVIGDFYAQAACNETGGRALRLFARVRRGAVRPQDIGGRWGGEEFTIVLPHTGAAAAATALERVRSELADTLKSGTTPRFTVSIGVAGEEDGQDFGAVLAAADGALLQAKEAGRDRVVVAGTLPAGPRPFLHPGEPSGSTGMTA